MTKQKLIESVRESGTDKTLIDMVVRFIDTAHQIGFAEGMARATQINEKTFEMLMGAK